MSQLTPNTGSSEELDFNIPRSVTPEQTCADHIKAIERRGYFLERKLINRDIESIRQAIQEFAKKHGIKNIIVSPLEALKHGMPVSVTCLFRRKKRSNGNIS